MPVCAVIGHELPNNFTESDIFQYFCQGDHAAVLLNGLLYFDTGQCPPPPANAGYKALSVNDPTFKKLAKEIQWQAIQNGFCICYN